jgi:hypothetical protein
MSTFCNGLQGPFAATRPNHNRSGQKANVRRGRGRKGNSHRKSRNNGDHRYLGRRRAQRYETDTALLEVMRSSPEGSIGDWAEATRRSRTSTVSALHRQRDAGLAESVGGKWRLIEPEAPRAPRWVEPVSAVAAASMRAAESYPGVRGASAKGRNSTPSRQLRNLTPPVAAKPAEAAPIAHRR